MYPCLTLPSTGTLTQNPGSTLYYASFTQTGGTINGSFQNQTTFTYQSGLFNGRLINQGAVNLGPFFTAGDGVENDASMTVNIGQTLTANGAGLTNLGTFTLAGGILSGSGPLLNDFSATMLANGTINPALTNNGRLTLTGVLRLNNASAPINHGIIDGSGTIIGNFANTAGGSINVGPTAALSINSPWSNSGLVTLQGAAGTLGGATITNSGTIQGQGTVNAPITNAGVIRAAAGQLVLAAVINNAPAGQIQADTNSSILITQGLPTNAGLIALAGGTFDNNNQPMSNTGSIEGNGILRTGGLTNASGGIINLADTPTSIFGPVTNNLGGNIHITSNTTTFFGPVTNNGTVKVTAGVARFLGNGVSMTVGGTYISDPSDNYFNGLNINPSGAVIGGVGDHFFLAGNSPFNNAGTYNNAGTLSATTINNTGTFIQSAGTATATTFNHNGGTLAIGGALTTNALALNAGTLLLDLTALGAIKVNAANALVLNGGAIQITSTPTGPASLGYYKIIQHNGFTGSLANLTLPAIVNNIAYTLSSTDAPGFIEIHRGFLGDANDDGTVNFADFIQLSNHYGQSNQGWLGADFDNNGTVNFSDFIILSNHYGQSITGAQFTATPDELAALNAFAADATSVPEPATLPLLAFATLSLLRHKRR